MKRLKNWNISNINYNSRCNPKFYFNNNKKKMAKYNYKKMIFKKYKII
jgi:hypothetical protein